jgi:hypothetical protein
MIAARPSALWETPACALHGTLHQPIAAPSCDATRHVASRHDALQHGMLCCNRSERLLRKTSVCVLNNPVGMGGLETHLVELTRSLDKHLHDVRHRLPHLHRGWAHPCHVCTGTGLAPATSAPER